MNAIFQSVAGTPDNQDRGLVVHGAEGFDWYPRQLAEVMGGIRRKLTEELKEADRVAIMILLWLMVD